MVPELDIFEYSMIFLMLTSVFPVVGKGFVCVLGGGGGRERVKQGT